MAEPQRPGSEVAFDGALERSQTAINKAGEAVEGALEGALGGANAAYARSQSAMKNTAEAAEQGLAKLGLSRQTLSDSRRLYRAREMAHLQIAQRHSA